MESAEEGTEDGAEGHMQRLSFVGWGTPMPTQPQGPHTAPQTNGEHCHTSTCSLAWYPDNNAGTLSAWELPLQGGQTLSSDILSPVIFQQPSEEPVM